MRKFAIALAMVLGIANSFIALTVPAVHAQEAPAPEKPEPPEKPD